MSLLIKEKFDISQAIIELIEAWWRKHVLVN